MAPFWVIEPSDIKIQRGQKISVECKAEGFPKPTIKWKSSNEEIFFGEVLEVNSRQNFASNYMCEADNGVGKPLVKSIRILMNGMQKTFFRLFV